MMLRRTEIELVDVHIESCPKCNRLPRIGYKRWAPKPFVCRCVNCNTDIVRGADIVDAVHEWNKWAIAEAHKIQEAEDAD